MCGGQQAARTQRSGAASSARAIEPESRAKGSAAVAEAGARAGACLLGLEAHDARGVEGRHDGRVLLRPLRAHNRLAAPEDVGGAVNLLFLHAGRHVIVLDDDAFEAAGRRAGKGGERPAQRSTFEWKGALLSAPRQGRGEVFGGAAQARTRRQRLAGGGSERARQLRAQRRRRSETPRSQHGGQHSDLFQIRSDPIRRRQHRVTLS